MFAKFNVLRHSERVRLVGKKDDVVFFELLFELLNLSCRDLCDVNVVNLGTDFRRQFSYVHCVPVFLPVLLMCMYGSQ